MDTFSWRHAIQKSQLNSTTKLVLLNISIYMNERGDGAFPSVPRQVNDTGLSERSIYKSLKLAVEAELLIKSKKKISGKVVNEYSASMKKTTPAPYAPLHQMQFTPAPDAPKLTNELSNSKKKKNKQKKENDFQDLYLSWFDEFWSIYPRTVAKKKAKEIYLKLMKGNNDDRQLHEKIINGASRYSAYEKRRGTEQGFIAHPSTWLNQERWEDDYSDGDKPRGQGVTVDGRPARRSETFSAIHALLEDEMDRKNS